MLPVIPKPPISRRRKRAALAVAVVVDLIQMPGFAVFGEGALSPFQGALDLITAIVLTVICGFKWQFVVAFGLELVPVAALFPTWTALVLTLPSASPSPSAEVQVSASMPPAQGRVRAAGGQGTVDVEGVIAPPVQRRSLADR